jgi:hypothetical protein
VRHVRERVGEGAVVRSDDIDDNDVIGEVALGASVWRFRVRCDDDGFVLGSELTPVDP